MSQRPTPSTHRVRPQRSQNNAVEPTKCSHNNPKTKQIRKDVFYKTQRLIGMFVAMAAFSLSFEDLVYANIIGACTKTNWERPAQITLVIILSILALLTMAASILAFIASLLYFRRSLRVALKIYKEHHRENDRLSEEDKKECQKLFFKHVVVEAISLSIANSVLTYLGRNPAERNKVGDSCNGNGYEILAEVIQRMNDYYGYVAIFVSFIVLVVGFFNYLRWIRRECGYHPSCWACFVDNVWTTKEVIETAARH
ncbi:hypothetical protein M3Y97_01149000 [Aphelenchoides bicaudatus]|nr:hypothetical protein M3Y97_01149000 [Aphelenchoides bicaudatus]